MNRSRNGVSTPTEESIDGLKSPGMSGLPRLEESEGHDVTPCILETSGLDRARRCEFPGRRIVGVHPRRSFRRFERECRLAGASSLAGDLQGEGRILVTAKIKLDQVSDRIVALSGIEVVTSENTMGVRIDGTGDGVSIQKIDHPLIHRILVPESSANHQFEQIRMVRVLRQKHGQIIIVDLHRRTLQTGPGLRPKSRTVLGITSFRGGRRLSDSSRDHRRNPGQSLPTRDLEGSGLGRIPVPDQISEFVE